MTGQKIAILQRTLNRRQYLARYKQIVTKQIVTFRMANLSFDRLAQQAEQHGTPYWIYDADVIRARISVLRCFDNIRFAQKACSNIHILKLMRREGVVVDAVSHGEILRSLAAGFSPEGEPEGLVYTADVIDSQTLKLCIDRNITINAGSIDMLERIGRCAPGHRVWLRINPGFGHGHSSKTNTGGPHSKHGIWHESLDDAIRIIRQCHLHLLGVHMHIGSGSDYKHLSSVCNSMVDVVRRMDCDIDAISAGGGLPACTDEAISISGIKQYFAFWDEARKEISDLVGHRVRIEVEPGRFLVADSGLLVCQVQSVKETPERCFAIVDAGFNDLVRPSLYGSYHRVSIASVPDGSLGGRPHRLVVIAGPLCEAGDILTQGPGGNITEQDLPEPVVGDLLCFHDVGAYGAAMSSNYNSRPLAPELLAEGDEIQMIRRRQRMEDLLRLEISAGVSNAEKEQIVTL